MHCDVGIICLGLCTDMKWQAYVCKGGEDDAPGSLKNALRRANSVAEIFMNEFQYGRSRQDISDATMKRAEAEGLRPLIYSHPIGFNGHGAGCQVNALLREERQKGSRNRWNILCFTALFMPLSSAV